MCALDFKLRVGTAQTLLDEQVRILERRVTELLTPPTNTGDSLISFADTLERWAKDERRKLSAVIYADWAKALSSASITIVD